MNTYYVISPKFDYQNAQSILIKHGYFAALNWANKRVATGKGDGVYPVIGIAVMDRETYLRYKDEVPIPKVFETGGSFFAGLHVSDEKALNKLISDLNSEW